MSETSNNQTTTDTSTTTTTSAPGAETNTPATTTVETQPTTTTAAEPTTTTTTEPQQQQTLLGQEQPTEQPIVYADFTMPEGFELNGDDSKVLQELGQQFKMPQEALQKLVDMGVQMQQRQVQEQQKTIASWVDAAKADPEYGGDKLEANLLTAQKAFTLPRGDKISKILHMSGLGNHPDVVGFMTEVGKLLQPDSITTGKGTNTTTPSLGQLWYGDK